MYDLKPQARPYAKAAFLAAVEEGQIDEMFRDLKILSCLLYTSPSPRDLSTSRMPSSA